MTKKILTACLILAAFSVPAMAATAEFYVEQDAKTHVCMVADKKADGKMMMDVGTKAYATRSNAEQAMTNLKVCAAAAAPATPAAAPKVTAPAAPAAAGFYVEQDAKTHACMVSDKIADGKLMMDVGTKAYATKSNAEQAIANLKACAAAATPAAPVTPAAAPKVAVPAAPAAAGFYVEQDAKTHKCMVSDAKPDGKMMMDVGTKVYETKGRADQAMSMLKACKG
jgi:prefoldin subunit 5